MRNCLQLASVNLPGFASPIPSPEATRLAGQLEQWHKSDFAGYRRLVEKGSDCHPDLTEVEIVAAKHRKGGTGKPIRDFVLLGTGGSSLGSETLIRCLRPQSKEPRFHFMDNNDPTWFSWLLASLNPEETLVYVVSKSGKTPETLSQFLAMLEWVKKSVPGESWRQHFVLCTDPSKGDLRELARRWKLSALSIPSPVGGRFSVLTPVGLFPAAFAGISVTELLDGAASIAAWERKDWNENPCARLARALALESTRRPITVLMPYSSQLSAFSRWFCQLWAESLGKNGKGLTPYPAVGTTDQHSQVQLYMEGPRDKSVILLHVKSLARDLRLDLPAELADLPAFAELKDCSMGQLFNAEFRATRDALTQQGVPNATLEVDSLDPYSLGALFFFWEWATAIAGATLGVNPFDQPGVEAAKILTKKYLAESR